MAVAVVPGSAPGREVSRSAVRGPGGLPAQRTQHTLPADQAGFEADQLQQIRGVSRIRAALVSLVGSARHELLSFDDPAAALGQGIPESFLRSGAPGGAPSGQTARVRRIAPRHGLCQLREPWRCLGEARVTESVPFKIIVVDRSVAAVPIGLGLDPGPGPGPGLGPAPGPGPGPGPDDNGVLLIRDPVVVQALVRTHQAWWETGEDPVLRVLPPGPPPHLGPVLDAILAGLTDDAAATRLNMSGRTYSRRVGELMAALGTTSRFRAGVEAARRGWI
ncbi:DNA-binding response regulator [Streptomyces tsukubensis]|uniref:DNA-binding response regulator n=1 Tax=Streptomyces tsukubensis TaxID=83656 RepID=UPI00344D1CE4